MSHLRISIWVFPIDFALFCFVVPNFSNYNYRLKYISDNSIVDSAIWGDTTSYPITHCLAIGTVSDQVFLANRYCSDRRFFICESQPSTSCSTNYYKAIDGTCTGKVLYFESKKKSSFKYVLFQPVIVMPLVQVAYNARIQQDNVVVMMDTKASNVMELVIVLLRAQVAQFVMLLQVNVIAKMGIQVPLATPVLPTSSKRVMEDVQVSQITNHT